MRVVIGVCVLLGGLYASSTSLQSMIDRKSAYYKSAVAKKHNFLSNQIERKYEELSSLIASKWGESNVALSTNTRFTQYSEDFSTRESIDFKHGVVKLETIVPANEKKDIDFFQKKLQTFLDEEVKEAVSKDPLQSSVTVDNNTQLKDLTPLKSTTITRRDIRQKFVKLGDKKRKIISVEVQMLPNHLQKRVKLYLPLVQKYAKKHHLKVSHVLATIHAESYFNPMAISKVPAYGLMQIVPSTAGADSYFILYGQKRAPSAKYLLNPKNNIELGTQYMQLIRDKYLKGIRENETMIYCMSTAYNAGVGSVYKVFAQHKSQYDKAIKNINAMAPQEVLQRLQTSYKLTTNAKNYVGLIQKYSKIYTRFDDKDFQ